MEDFIEIIFYVVILVLSGIGSLLKNKKKQQKTQSPATIFSDNTTENQREKKQEVDDVFKKQVESTTSTFTSDVLDETDFERMFREVAEMAEVKQREKETFERQQHEEELRQKAIAEQNKKAELLRAEKAKESAKKQQKVQNNNFDIDEEEATLPFALNFSDASEVRRAFISSEILNRKY
ncbi:MAG: cell envelope integrity protein TolA [Paludibacteraceae bacterium]|nr:cell envelope integrity protein TolA [Paludibacteraceae bacterium]